MPVDPNSTSTANASVATSASATISTVAAAADTAAATMVTPSRPSTRPISPLLPQPHQLHYASQSLYTAQPFPSRTSNTSPHSQFTEQPHDPSQGILYPVASSGRGFIIPRIIHPLSTDQMVTVARPGGAGGGGGGGGGGYPPPSLVFPHGIRTMGSPPLDYLNHPWMTIPSNLQYPHLVSAGGAVKGVPVPSQSKAAPLSAIPDRNGYKDTRERSRDDTFIMVRDRKVRITEDASLYTLCRSWLRNGVYEEFQPQQKDFIKALPRPLPASVVASYLSKKKEEEDDKEQEEDEKSVENLTHRDILKRHIKRSKKVRARSREERLQRITRYRNRLRLLLPPPVEQFRNDGC